MEDSLVGKIAAVRQASDMGCFGAHQISNGEWLPCSSTKQFLTIMNGFDVKSRISLDEMENWSSIRKSKGKKRKKRWEKLRERRVLGIESLDNGGLVSPRNSTNMINGGTNPPITYGATNPSSMSTKSVQPAFMPRDNDPDVFIDIESARKRAQQLGCVGISRRMSKGGKTIWMPCTNITDYNNLTGMTALGRNNLQKRNEKIVRTVIKENLKKKKTTIQEDIYGKALGPRIRGIARAAMSRFDPNAFDGDGDAIIQDGTTFERPNTPNARIPKTVDREVSPSEVSAVRQFINAMTSSQMDSFRGEPIEAYDGVPGSRRGLASSGPGFIIDPKGPKQMGARKATKPLAIAELRNSEASPTNPFRNLGGRLMSKLIRGMVRPEHRRKQDRTTFLIGGNTGSGKTTVLDEHLIPKGLVPSHEEAALIDPDFIKKGLVGYDDGDGAGRVHRESQASTDKTIRDAALDEMDMVITGSGASRQIQHMREASERGEKVVGHWVHVPQQEASRRIKKRIDETNRYIPDNTAHMAQSIPKVISTGFEEDLLDEFYLWDNDVPEGSPPKLIAKKVRGKKFEIYDAKKFEEFAGSKKWADTWVNTSEKGDVPRKGFESSTVVPSPNASMTTTQIEQRIKFEQAKGDPRTDTKDYENDVEKIVSRSVPTTQKELEQILTGNPFVPQTPGELQKIKNYIKKLDIDWGEQVKLAEVFRKTLNDSPGLRKLLSITDVPPMLMTKKAADNDQIIGNFTMSTDNTQPWGDIHGMYHVKHGLVLYSPSVTGGKNVKLDGVTHTPEYTLRHELGHSIFAMLARMNPEAEDELRAHLQLVANEYGEIDKKIKALVQKMRNAYSQKEIDKLKKNVETLVRSKNRWRSNLLTEMDALWISDYAATNVMEYIAEVIARMTAPESEFSVKSPPRRIREDKHIEWLSQYLGLDKLELQKIREMTL